MRGGLAAVLAGAVMGPVLQLQQRELWAWWVYAGMAAASLVAASIFRRHRAAAFLVIPLAFAVTGWRACAYQSHALDPALEGRDIEVTGIVAAMPQRNELGVRFRLEVEHATDKLPPLLQLGWYDGAADPRPGERWLLTARLKAPHGNLNPHGFDYELWLWEQGVQATGYVREARRVGATWRHPVEQARHAVRDAIFERVADRRVAGILAGLVVGDQAAIERADWDVFRATGVAHLMSISGLHITMFAWAAAALVTWAWRRSARLCLALPAQHAALLAGTGLAAAYALFSGWGIPAQRTVWMLATVALLRLGGRAWPWPMMWLLVCAVVVTLDPWALMQAGFWLSFVAVGVLFASGTGHEGSRAMRLVREQLVVTAALSPLSLLLFGQVSVVGLAANLFAIPWVTLVITPLAMAGVLIAPAWDAAALAVQALASALQWLAAWPAATLSVPAAPLWAGIAGVVGGAMLAMRLPPALRALGLPLMLPVALWQPVRPPAGEFELLAADVGQGNAVIVRTATSTLVYDAGPRYSAESDAGHRVIVPLLRAFGERVDQLVLSHRDTDHTGGAAAILAMQPAAALLSSIEPGHELQQLRPATRCEAGQRWRRDGVTFEFLHPRAEDYAETPRPNALSCVLRISNGRASALLAGDIEKAQELRLAPTLQPADLLLVPHHGSKTSSSEPFLDAVRPAVALVQAGYRNRFGHPAPPVLARYDERGIAVVGSAQCGAARWRSQQPGEISCERAVAQRYWHHKVP
ncbi:DNA internalization-related competence protein ComEC/Rec2 [Ramlibacter albus]|uniref:DNA internalization-related competence protein ComEC/Rec2 n=1 Tax=Ramlibacter albus TaxID=2079448 RepID=A0A923MC37_9BURK|nr:DNA internalization-related competence protein ComEC/Rec2 [Ramlibacter albus]MBC5766322.1 DNA internalization-related competence protein ComEC/Rec2 [Ramlibacter albus]